MLYKVLIQVKQLYCKNVEIRFDLFSICMLKESFNILFFYSVFKSEPNEISVYFLLRFN